MRVLPTACQHWPFEVYVRRLLRALCCFGGITLMELIGLHVPCPDVQAAAATSYGPTRLQLRQ